MPSQGCPLILANFNPGTRVINVSIVIDPSNSSRYSSSSSSSSSSSRQCNTTYPEELIRRPSPDDHGYSQEWEAQQSFAQEQHQSQTNTQGVQQPTQQKQQPPQQVQQTDDVTETQDRWVVSHQWSNELRAWTTLCDVNKKSRLGLRWP